MAVEFVSANVHYVEDLVQAVVFPSQAGDVVVVVFKANGVGDDRLRAALARQMTRLYPLGDGAYVGHIAATGPSRIDLSDAGQWALYGEVGWAIYRGGQVKGLTYRPSTYSEPTWPAAPYAGPGFAVRLMADLKTGGWNPPAPGTARAAREQVSIGDEVLADGVSPGELALNGISRLLISATVVVGPSAPSAPRITLPSQVDFTLPQQLAWTPDGTQTAYQVRKVDGATTTYWDGTAWVGSEVWVPGTATSISIAGVNGASYTYGVRTRSASDRPGDGSEATATVKGVASPPAPTVTVSGVTDGKLNKLTTTVTVAGAAGAGGALTGHGLRVVSADRTNLVRELEVKSGSDGSHSWEFTPTTPLPNNVILRFEGFTQQDGIQLSPASEATVTVEVPAPPAPNAFAEQITHPTSGLPGLRVIVSTRWEAPIRIELERAPVVAGVVGKWVPLARIEGKSTIGIRDYATTGEVAYRARVVDSDLPEIAGDWTEVRATAASRGGWLVDPQRPELAQLVSLQQWGERSSDLRTTVQATIHSGAWYVTSLEPTDRKGSMTVLTHTVPNESGISPLDRLLTALYSGRQIVFTLPDERVPAAVGGAETHIPGERVRMLPEGSPSVAHAAQTNTTLRLVSWNWVEQPYTGTAAVVTTADAETLGGFGLGGFGLIAFGL